MAFIPTAQCCRLSLVGTLNGQAYVNTLWFLFPGGDFTQTDMENLADAVETWWTAQMPGLFSSGLCFSNINVLDQRAQDAPTVTTTAAMCGTNASGSEPNNVAVVASFRSANRGRGSRGRNYLGGIPIEKLTSPTHITGAYALALVNAYEALNPAIAASGWAHVVVSHYLNKVARSAGYAQTVTAYVVDTALDSARRRLAGRGT